MFSFEIENLQHESVLAGDGGSIGNLKIFLQWYSFKTS